MTWGEIAKAVAALAVDLARDWARGRKPCPSCGWTYQDVKRVNDITHRAGHEHAERRPQR